MYDENYAFQWVVVKIMNAQKCVVNLLLFTFQRDLYTDVDIQEAGDY